MLKIPKGVRIRLDEMRMYPDDKVAILTTGSQGEPMSASGADEQRRVRPSAGQTWRHADLLGSPDPRKRGRHLANDHRLFNQGCTVVYESATPIHVSGHAYQEELKMMIKPHEALLRGPSARRGRGTSSFTTRSPGHWAIRTIGSSR